MGIQEMRDLMGKEEGATTLPSNPGKQLFQTGAQNRGLWEGSLQAKGYYEIIQSAAVATKQWHPSWADL